MATPQMLPALSLLLFLSVSALGQQPATTHEAVRENGLRRAGELPPRDPQLIDLEDDDGKTPLHLAAWLGRGCAAGLLLARGARLDILAASGLGLGTQVRALLRADEK